MIIPANIPELCASIGLQAHVLTLKGATATDGEKALLHYYEWRVSQLAAQYGRERVLQWMKGSVANDG
jgi:hypothetical protein